MRKSNLFWAVILILVGILLLLNSLDILNVDVWGLIWPLFLILLGIWTLWGVFFSRQSIEEELKAKGEPTASDKSPSKWAL